MRMNQWLNHRLYPWAAAALLLFGAVWIGVNRTAPSETTQGGLPIPRAGFIAPDFTLEDQNGDLVTLSRLRAGADAPGSVVIVNLWASWCIPCREEMPALERVSQAYRDQGLVVLAVNATHQDSRAAALAFAEENQLTFPILFDDAGEVSRLYQLGALPTTFFIHRDGTIEEVVIGGPIAEALLRSRVERLLEGGR